MQTRHTCQRGKPAWTYIVEYQMKNELWNKFQWQNFLPVWHIYRYIWFFKSISGSFLRWCQAKFFSLFHWHSVELFHSLWVSRLSSHSLSASAEFGLPQCPLLRLTTSTWTTTKRQKRILTFLKRLKIIGFCNLYHPCSLIEAHKARGFQVNFGGQRKKEKYISGVQYSVSQIFKKSRQKSLP